MSLSRSLLTAVIAAATLSHPASAVPGTLDACSQIQSAVSSASSVYLPGQLSYDEDVSHWATSSSQVAQCSVEPGTASDVGIILNILSSTQTPFAVKGGGHATNPGFSSTTGVQIAMSRFSEVNYDSSSQTVTFGSGLIWDDVYAALAPHGVNVVGGRVSGVGVAGFTLGGGYSWKTNQFGLTVDTVTAFELVKPNGTVATVTADSDPELFFGLKGGQNNFGIVTRFTLKAHPQGQVWGGIIMYTSDQIPLVIAATARFSSSVTDPKAAIITTANFFLGQPGIAELLFYDGPSPPEGIFDDFLAIDSLTSDVSTRDFLSLVQVSPANASAGLRGIFQSVPVKQYTPTLLDAIFNETAFWGSRLALSSAAFMSYAVEPFLPSAFLHNTSEAAYPPSSARSQGLLPSNIYFAWTSSLSDSEFYDAARQSAARIQSVAESEGQTDLAAAPLYPNYAIFSTPLENMYAENVARLKALKNVVDPDNVMGLAGGFKF